MYPGGKREAVAAVCWPADSSLLTRTDAVSVCIRWVNLLHPALVQFAGLSAIPSSGRLKAVRWLSS